MAMIVSTFVNPDRRSVWTLKVDVPNRRVVTLAGKIGGNGRRTTRVFDDNESVRECAENLTDHKVALGFVQVA